MKGKQKREEGEKRRRVVSLERTAIVSVGLSYSELSVVPWVLLGASWPQGSANRSL